MSIDDLLDDALAAGWTLLPPEAATVDADARARAPDDLRQFLARCGGLQSDKGVRVGQRIVHAQEAILGERHADDRSVDWYVIAEESDAATAERLVMDFHPARRGRCYDAFWDRFGVAGSMPVAARSFTELLERLRASDGAPYWSGAEPELGDAYE